jgi:hypothetical protein
MSAILVQILLAILDGEGKEQHQLRIWKTAVASDWISGPHPTPILHYNYYQATLSCKALTYTHCKLHGQETVLYGVYSGTIS